jgi:hypothetical protein
MNPLSVCLVIFLLPSWKLIFLISILFAHTEKMETQEWKELWQQKFSIRFLTILCWCWSILKLMVYYYCYYCYYWGGYMQHPFKYRSCVCVCLVWKWFKKANGIFKLMLWLAALILIKMYVNSFKLHLFFLFCRKNWIFF